MNIKVKNSLYLLAGLAGLIFLIYYFDLDEFAKLSYVQEKSSALCHLVKENYWVAVIIYMIIYILIIACALPAVAPLSMLGGYLFGLVRGFLFALTSATLGSTIYFLLMRYVFSNLAKNKFGDRLTQFNERMKKYGATYLLTLQLLTIIPFFVINTFAALADVSLPTFIWTTIVGTIPLQGIYVFAGQELSTINSVKDILKPPILMLFFLLALLAFLPMIIRRFKSNYEV